MHQESLDVLLAPEGFDALQVLYEAAVDGERVGDLARLAAQVPSLNFRNSEGRTVAMFAAASGNAEGLRVLAGLGCDLRLHDDDGLTAVHFAVSSGCDLTLQTSLECGGPVASPNFCLDTPLHVAARAGRASTVEVLIHHGASLFPPNDEGDTPLGVAARHGHVAVVTLLLQSGGDACVALEAALTYSPIQLDVIHSLFAGGMVTDPNVPLPVTKLLPLAVAVARGDPVVCQTLIDHGCRIDGPDGTFKGAGWMSPLTAAIQFECLVGVRWVLAHAASPSKADGRGLTPLYVACLGRAPHAFSSPVVSAPSVVATAPRSNTLRQPTLPSANDQSPDSDAFGVEVLQLLIEQGAPISPTPSPLQGCAKSGRLPLLRAWLTVAFPNSPPALASLPIAGAAVGDAVQRGHWDMVDALLDGGANVFPDRRVEAAVAVVTRGGPHALFLKLLPASLSQAQGGKLLDAALDGASPDALREVIQRAVTVFSDATVNAMLDAKGYLARAVQAGNAACATVLIQQGAPVAGLGCLLTSGAEPHREALLCCVLRCVGVDTVAAPQLIDLLCSASGLLTLDQSPTISEQSPLLSAVRQLEDNVAAMVVDVLRRHGITRGLQCALTNCCQSGKLECVRRLAGGGLGEFEDSASCSSESPSLCAFRGGSLAVTECLYGLDAGAVHTACLRWKAASLSALLTARGVGLGGVGNPLWTSLIETILGSLLASDLTPTFGLDGSAPPLHAAAACLDVHVVATLLKLGADVNEVGVGYSPICAASRSTAQCTSVLRPAGLEVVRLLLDAGADSTLGCLATSSVPRNAVVESASDPELFQMLWVTVPESSSCRRDILRESLVVACQALCCGVVEMLMRDAHTLAPADTIPAVLATASSDNTEALLILNAFREGGVDLSDSNVDVRETALHRAATNGCVAVVEFLLRVVPEPNPIDSRGYTPFMCAVRSPKLTLQLLRALLDGGVDARLPDGKGVTPLRAMREEGVRLENGAALLRFLEWELGWRYGGEAKVQGPPSFVSPGVRASVSPGGPPAATQFGFSFGGTGITFGPSAGVFTGIPPPARSMVSPDQFVGVVGPKSLDFSDAESLAKINALSAEAKRSSTLKAGLGKPTGPADDKSSRLQSRGHAHGGSPPAPLTAAAKAALEVTSKLGSASPFNNPNPVAPAVAPRTNPDTTKLPPLPAAYKFFTLDSLVTGDTASVFRTFEDRSSTFVTSRFDHKQSTADMNDSFQQLLEVPCNCVAAASQQLKACTELHATFVQRCSALIPAVATEFLSADAGTGDARAITADGIRFLCSFEFDCHVGTAAQVLLQAVISCVPGLHAPLCAVFDMAGVRILAVCQLEPVRVLELPPSVARVLRSTAVPAPATTSGGGADLGIPAGDASATAPDVLDSTTDPVSFSTLWKAIDVLVKRPIDTFPQAPLPDVEVRDDLKALVSSLDAQLFGDCGLSTATWVESQGCQLVQAADGRLYIDAKLPGCVKLPSALVSPDDVFYGRHIPSDTTASVELVPLPLSPFLDLCRVAFDAPNIADECVALVVPADLCVVFQRWFGGQVWAQEDVIARAHQYTSEDLVVVVTGPAQESPPSNGNSVLLDCLREIGLDRDIASDLANTSGDALLLVVSLGMVNRAMHKPCRMELVGSVVRTLDSLDTLAEVIPLTLGKSMRAYVNRLDTGLQQSSRDSSTTSKYSLQNVVSALKHGAHAQGINMRCLGYMRQLATSPLLRSAFLCEMIARTARHAVRSAWRGCTLPHGPAAMVGTLRKLFCLANPRSVSSPVSDDSSSAASTNPSQAEWSHVFLKEALLQRFQGGLTPDEVSGVISESHPPHQQRSLWHSLTPEEQRVTLHQFQRLVGVQFAVELDQETGEVDFSNIVISCRPKSLRPYANLVGGRQQSITTDGKRHFVGEVARLMKQIIRRGSVVELPALLPSLCHLSDALGYALKSQKNSISLGMRVHELASYLHRSVPDSQAFMAVKLRALRNVGELYSRWYRHADSAVILKKLVTEAASLFGKDSAEAQVAMTQYGHAILQTGVGNAKSAKMMLRQVLELAAAGVKAGEEPPSGKDLHLVAVSNYAAALYCTGSPEAALKLLASCCPSASQHGNLLLAHNTAVLSACLGDMVTACGRVEGMLHGSSSPDCTLDLLGLCSLLLRLFIDCGRVTDALRFGEQFIHRCKRVSAPPEVIARFHVLMGEALLTDVSPKAAWHYATACTLFESRYGPSYPLVLEVRALHAEACHLVGDTLPSEALRALGDCTAAARAALGEAHPVFGRTVHALARVESWRQCEVAVDSLADALPALARLGISHPHHINALCDLAVWSGVVGDLDHGTTYSQSAVSAAECFQVGALPRVRAAYTQALLQKDDDDVFTASGLLDEEAVPYVDSIPDNLASDIQELRAELVMLSYEADYAAMFGQGEEEEEYEGADGEAEAAGMGSGEGGHWTDADWEAYEREQDGFEDADPEAVLQAVVHDGDAGDGESDPETGGDDEDEDDGSPYDDQGDSGVIGDHTADSQSEAETVPLVDADHPNPDGTTDSDATDSGEDSSGTHSSSSDGDSNTTATLPDTDEYPPPE